MDIVQAKILPGPRISSSIIRSLLEIGDVESSANLLGYYYSIQGIVRSGYKIGRTLGFPTANISMEDITKLLPADGVYAVKVYLEDSVYMGMLNIGNRPTMNNGNTRTVEVHLLDFNEDLYDKSLRLEFICRIRGEQKFDNIEALKNQLQKDSNSVRDKFRELV